MALLKIERLTKYYDETCALSDVSFKLKKGEFVSVIGPSGSGKTTLIRCINRLITASDGDIVFDKKRMLELRGAALRHARARIGMIFQHYNLVYRLSVIENVLHGRLGYKSNIAGIFSIYTEAEKQKALEVLELVGLEKEVYRRCDQLSGGQKQRVGIARALVQNPLLILCDEPISSLDPGSAKVVMDYLRKIQEELDITMVVNLHQVDVAKKYSTRILGFNQGELVYDGDPQGITKKKLYSIYGAQTGELIND
ncbi:MAG: phosphonate ABC transporter ATP-binding protein [Fibrobacterota bacterium]